MKRLLVLLLVICALRAEAQSYSRARILLDDAHRLPQLQQAGIATDHGQYRKGQYFQSDFSAGELRRARAAGFRVEVLIADVSAFYARQNDSARPQKKSLAVRLCDTARRTRTVPQHFRLGSYAGYYTYAELLSILDSMHQLYPNLISARQPIDSFQSIEGRPIYWVRVSDSASVSHPLRPQGLWTSVHHAREPGSLSANIFFLWHLLEQYGTDPRIKAILEHTELYFIPCVNPDGYIYNVVNNPQGGGLWRKNRRLNADGSYGVDLNRNYGAEWGYDDFGSSPNPPSETYRGTAAFSEPETRAVRLFCRQHHFRTCLNYHSYNNDIVYPWGYIPSLLTPDSSYYSSIADYATELSHYNFGTCDQTLHYITNGDADDWMYGDAATTGKIFAMTPEVGKVDEGFYPPANRIIPNSQDNLESNIRIASLLLPLARTRPDNPVARNLRSGFLNYDLTSVGAPGSTFTVGAVSLSPFLTIPATTRTHTALANLQQVSDSIPYILAANIPDNTLLRYALTVQNGLYPSTDTVECYYYRRIDTTVLPTETLAGWDNIGWGLSSRYHSPQHSLQTSLTGEDFYSDNEELTLQIHRPVDLAGAQHAYLQFFAKWDIEQDYDYVTVMARPTGSTQWTQLCGRYTKPGEIDQLPGAPVYDGQKNNWVLEQMDLAGFLGGPLDLMFLLRSDGGGNGYGFYLDDARVIASRASTSVLPGATGAGSLTVVPNPAQDFFFIRPGRPGGDTVSLLDLSGRELRRITVPGSGIRVSSAGLAPGLYLLRSAATGSAARLVVAGR